MLVRYRMNSTCTLANMQTDINNIILGNVTNVSQLSSGADQTNSVIYGSYPTGKYARVNGTSYTYSKVHNDASTSKTHYFRLTYDATQLTTFALAQSYTSGTDTLVNSYAATVNIQRFPFVPAIQNGIDIVISDKVFVIMAPQSGSLIGIVDIGHNSVSRAYTNSMLMVLQDFNNVPNWGVLSQTVQANTGTTIPYYYNYDISAYGTLTTGISGIQTTRRGIGNGITAVFENPMFNNTTGAAAIMYGCYRIPFLTFSGIQVYKDASNAYRLTVNDISLLVD